MKQEAQKGSGRMTDGRIEIQLQGALAMLAEAERRVEAATGMLAASLVIASPPAERGEALRLASLGEDERDRITAAWIGAPESESMDECTSNAVMAHLSVAGALREKLETLCGLLAIDVLRDAPDAAYEAVLAPLVGDRARGIADMVRLRDESRAAAKR